MMSIVVDISAAQAIFDEACADGRATVITKTVHRSGPDPWALWDQ